MNEMMETDWTLQLQAWFCFECCHTIWIQLFEVETKVNRIKRVEYAHAQLYPLCAENVNLGGGARGEMPSDLIGSELGVAPADARRLLRPVK